MNWTLAGFALGTYLKIYSRTAFEKEVAVANKEITLDEFHDHINKLGVEEVLLDVRTPLEFSESHVPGSININHEDVADYVNDLKKYKTIYIMCRAGRRAQVAYAALEKEGFDNLVCISDAGMATWVERGYPVE